MRPWWLVPTVLASILGPAAGWLPAAGSGARAHAQARSLDSALIYPVPIDQAPARGPADALVTIVELSDFACSFCARAQETLAELERLFPGQLRMVYRHNPLDMEEGTLAAEASLAAAAQGWFWPMHDRLFASGGMIRRAQVEDIALELGLDMARFRDDLDRRRYLPQVQADARVAHGLGMESTPVFFINGRLIKGARPLSVFVRIVEEELARARALVASGVAPARVYETLMMTATAAAPAGARGQPATPARGGEEPDDPRAAGQIDPSRRYRVGLGLPGHALGPGDALLTVVVFTDFECPYCARFGPVLNALRAIHGDDVRIVLRHMPLSFHPRAQLAAEAAVAAAAQDKLWAFHDRVFAEPEALTRADLERHARAIGLDMAAFRAALDDRRYFELVAADVAAGKALGVSGTPTLFLNGIPMTGAAPLEHTQRIFVAPRLAEARALVESGVPRAQVYDTWMRRADIEVRSADSLFSGSTNESSGMEQDDVRSALIRACRIRDSMRARELYEGLDGGGWRPWAWLSCRTNGIDLDEPGAPVQAPAPR